MISLNPRPVSSLKASRISKVLETTLTLVITLPLQLVGLTVRRFGHTYHNIKRRLSENK